LLTDLREWLEYHHARGVSRFYLYDEFGDNEKHQAIVLLEDLILSKVVIYEDISMDRCIGGGQLMVYYRCVNDNKHRHKWLGFLDINDYIVLDDDAQHIPDFLSNYTQSGGVALQRVVYGSSGHLKRQSGGVSDYYKCAPLSHNISDQQLKTLVNTEYITTGAWHPRLHTKYSDGPQTFQYAADKFAVTTDGQHVHDSNSNNEHNSNTKSHQFAHINYYATRSLEDFQLTHPKREPRGDSARNIRGQEFFDEIDNAATEVCPILNTTKWQVKQ
jgi:Glycosyltransferase family 92